MKQLLPLIIILLLFAAITVQNNSSENLTQLVVSIPELSRSDLKNNLVQNLNKLKGVTYCETSLSTKTLVLNFDSRKVKITDIENILRKWECRPNQFFYQKLSSTQTEG